MWFSDGKKVESEIHQTRAEKPSTALHPPVASDYVGRDLGVGINGTATNGGSMVSPPLPTSAPSSNGHHDNDTSSSAHVQSASPPYHHPIKQSRSPTHHTADPISPTSASVTSGGFAKPSPVVVGTNNSTTASGKSFYFVLWIIVSWYLELFNCLKDFQSASLKYTYTRHAYIKEQHVNRFFIFFAFCFRQQHHFSN